MTTYRLAAPDPEAIATIGDMNDHSRGVRIVLGVGYTTSDHIAEWVGRKGYSVETVDEIPQDHLDKVARLDAFPVQFLGSLGDGEDPEQRFMVTAADGHTAVDLRDIINGTATIDDNGRLTGQH
ncbi:hypothetical protein [Agromyces albus]|uniref:hypothetical protein n=1 Tax=Agromyces albus TaxID=205332 RepID=UPI002786107A|nr:hypothetical protein [Agromyces albus]MDQ0576461.1 hypothetical protein [Agromyces albus]